MQFILIAIVIYLIFSVLGDSLGWLFDLIEPLFISFGNNFFFIIGAGFFAFAFYIFVISGASKEKTRLKSKIDTINNNELIGVDSMKNELRGMEDSLYKVTGERTLQNFRESLERSLNRPDPSTFMFEWSGRRQLRKIGLNVEKQRLVLEELNNFRLTIDGIAELKAKLEFAPELAAAIVQGYRDEVNVNDRAHKSRMQAFDDEDRLRKATVDSAEEEVKTAKTRNYIDRLIGVANAEAISAGARAEKARAEMLERLNEEMDFNNISSSQAYVLAKGLNPNDSSATDFSIKERMFEEDLFKAKQQNRMNKADADLREHSVNDEIREDEES